jgi:hypothetical protein
VNFVYKEGGFLGFLIRYFHFSCFVGGWTPKYDVLIFSASGTFLAANNYNKRGHFADQVVSMRIRFLPVSRGRVIRLLPEKSLTASSRIGKGHICWILFEGGDEPRQRASVL